MVEVEIGEWKLIYKDKELGKDKIVYVHPEKFLETPRIEFRNLRHKFSKLFPRNINEILKSFNLFDTSTWGIEDCISCDPYSFEKLWKEFEKERKIKIGNREFRFVIVTRNLDEVMDEIVANLI